MYGMNWYPQAQPMTMTDIGQVSSEQEAVNAYVAAGRSKIMFTADDQAVFVKSVSMNGQASMDVFVRRTETPQTAAPDYVTRDELKAALDALKAAKKPIKEATAE
jgi:hypothetical protein